MKLRSILSFVCVLSCYTVHSVSNTDFIETMVWSAALPAAHRAGHQSVQYFFRQYPDKSAYIVAGIIAGYAVYTLCCKPHRSGSCTQRHVVARRRSMI